MAINMVGIATLSFLWALAQFLILFFNLVPSFVFSFVPYIDSIFAD